MAREDIKAHAEQLNIPFLIHFTRIANLASILEHGLYPVSRTGEIGAAPEINDQLRLDGHLDGTSLSIAFTNNKMFWRIRKDNPQTEWVILAVDPSVLWEKTCAFCRHNAADARISCQELDALRTIESFRGMFDQIDGIATREQQRLKPFDPTDVQAEVLVFDVIEPKYIGGIQFETDAHKAQYAAILGVRETLVGTKRFFATRSYNRR